MSHATVRSTRDRISPRGVPAEWGGGPIRSVKSLSTPADRFVRARELADAGQPLQINTTVRADTASELPAIRDPVRDPGAVPWSVFLPVPAGRARVLDPIIPDRAEAATKWLHRVADEGRFGVRTTDAPFHRRVGLQRAVKD